MAGSRPRVTAAICAYNEAANLPQLLQTLLQRDAASFDELLVVSSGSTDGTDEIARGFAAGNASLRLISEPERRGKAGAVNTVLREATGDVILLIDGDCLPAEGTLEALLRHFDDPGAGGAGSRNVPVNGDEGRVARLGALLWDLHHEVNLRRPVLGGDIVAFRRAVASIPESTVNDDYAIEAALRGQGLRVDYEPQAAVLMRVPTTARDFLRQRRRIWAGFRAEGRRGETKATQDTGAAVRGLGSMFRRRPSGLPWLIALVAMESLARLSVLVDEARGRPGAYTAWQPAASTKRPLGPPA